jgi:hypothetical protein
VRFNLINDNDVLFANNGIHIPPRKSIFFIFIAVLAKQHYDGNELDPYSKDLP